MGEALPEMLTVGLPNTLILACLGRARHACSAWCWPSSGISRIALAALAGPRLHRHLPRPAGHRDDPADRPRPGPLGRQIWGPNPYPLGILALSLIAAAYIGEIFRSGIQSVEAGSSRPPARWASPTATAMRLVVDPAGRPPGAAGAGQPVHRADQGLVAWSTSSGLLATQRELFRIGQDHAANTGNLSALLLAGVFYLLITVPLTHVVNAIDRRLRTGRRADGTTPPTTTAGRPPSR